MTKNGDEEIYHKLEQLEHILKRPDTYVGTIEFDERKMWVCDPETAEANLAEENPKLPKLELRKIKFVPGLYKIFDEILVNAADHAIRDSTVTEIRVVIKQEENIISIQNNGSGVPVVIHADHDMYVPELIFGHLLTSDNYDDTEEKVVGGRNGYGAKLTNVFSTSFMVETCDAERKLGYKQIFSANMQEKSIPEITTLDGAGFTRITFSPDLERFKMKKLDDDIVALFYKRVCDIAGTTNGRVTVFLNDKQIPFTTFDHYVDLYFPPPAPADGDLPPNGEEAAELAPEVFRANFACERWEVVVALSTSDAFQQVSFANSICTSKGGTHVKHIAEQLVKCIYEKAQSEAGKKGLGTNSVDESVVWNQLSIFVNCLVVNPTFDSQTKDTLTLKKSSFGSQCELSEEVKAKVLNESKVVDAVLSWADHSMKNKLAQRNEQNASFGRKNRIFVKKLDDANWAGTKNSKHCTLILVEGDSAKSTAIAGLAVVGRDKFGVFPLRGKLLNVRDISLVKTLKNEEIHNLLKILALDPAKKVETADDLRYGQVMIMTDQDLDGSHIKGLLINLFQYWFPKLMASGFLKEFLTPLVKCTKAGEEPREFFSSAAYEAWKRDTPNSASWTCKYYKGLGTSTSEEARTYFNALSKHEVQFEYEDEKDDDLIDMAFNSSRADDRKDWITGCDDEAEPDTSGGTLKYSEFINVELVQFSKYNVRRAIPSAIDGLKPSQRKVLFCCFKKDGGVTSDIKVAQLSGYVSEQSQYHHGEVSLQEAIIKLAQDYVGSNNINLLVPNGMFGTRAAGGKDHSASRYIFTRLSKVTRALFPRKDDPILEYLDEEGISIEPKWYCPVIPLLLVNGAMGMGTGWSTQVPQYNPRDLIENCRRYIRGENLIDLMPWYRGFKGTITKSFTPDEAEQNVARERYDICGMVHARTRTMLEITELPVGRWTNDYKKDVLHPMLPSEGNLDPVLADMREYHTENSVHFVCSLTPDKQRKLQGQGILKALRLKSTISMDNMHAFSADGVVTRYKSWRDIFFEFATTRIKMYEKRKTYWLNEFERQYKVLENRVRFIQMVIEETLVIEERKTADLIEELIQLGFVSYRALYPESTQKEYDYLLKQKLWQLTEEKTAELREEMRNKAAEIEALKQRTELELWLKDLDDLVLALDMQDKADLKEQMSAQALNKKDNGSMDLTNNPCVLFINSNKQIRRINADLIRKVHGKNNQGRPVGNVDPTSEEMSIMLPCHNFDTIIAVCEDSTLVAFPALRVPSSKCRDKKGNHALDALIPELGGKSLVTLLTVEQENMWDHKLIILVSEKGYLAKSKLGVFRRMCEGKSGRTMRLRDGDKVRYASLADPDGSVVFTTSRCSVSHVPLSYFPLRNKGTSGNRVRLFLKVEENPSLKIHMCVCPKELGCETQKVKNFKPAKVSGPRPVSAFLIFMRETQKKQREEAVKIESCSTLGPKWKALDQDNKQYYEQLALVERENMAPKIAKEEAKIEVDSIQDEAEEVESEEEESNEEEEEKSDGKLTEAEEELEVEKHATEPCVIFVTALGRGARYPLAQFPYTRYTAKGMAGPKLADPADEVVSLALVHPAPQPEVAKVKSAFYAWFSDPQNKEEINPILATYDGHIMIKIGRLRKDYWPTVPSEVKAKYEVPEIPGGDDVKARSGYAAWYAANKESEEVKTKLEEMDSSLSSLQKYARLKQEVWSTLPAEEKQKYDLPKCDLSQGTRPSAMCDPTDVAEASSAKDISAVPVSTSRQPETREDLWLCTQYDHVHRLRPSNVVLCRKRRMKLDSRKLAKLAAGDRVAAAGVLTVDLASPAVISTSSTTLTDVKMDSSSTADCKMEGDEDGDKVEGGEDDDKMEVDE